MTYARHTSSRLTGTIPCDVSANFGADGLAGIIYIAALPYLTPPSFPDSITAVTASLLAVQADPIDVTSYLKAKTGLVDAIWKKPGDVDHRLRLTWLAPSYVQSPQVMRNLLTRSQDPTKLFEALRGGLPVLFIHGDADKMVDGERTRRQMAVYSPNADIYVVRGAGHAPFHEDQDEFVHRLIEFVRRVDVHMNQR